jgi:N-acyl-D-amino-acid deacylase
MYDIIIKNGNIADGTGKTALYVADLGIKNGKITTIGSLQHAQATRSIDANGLVVSPGFIDVQNHSDSHGALFMSPALESMLYQGITTIFIGQCGSSLAPLLKGSLNSIRKWTSVAGINVNWSSMSEFIKELKRKGLGTNIGTLVGHTTLRRSLVGDEVRSLTPREEKQAESLYRRSLREGAFGLSVGLEYSHDRVSEEEELIKLLEITAKKGKVASFHLRDEKKGIASSIDEIVFLAKSSGAKTKIAHFKAREEKNVDFAQEFFTPIERAHKNGIEIYFDIYPYTISTSVLYLLLPYWATEEGRDSLLEKLKNRNLRAEIIKEMKAQNYNYKNFRISSASIDITLIGKNIEELANNQATSPEEVVINLIKASEDQIIIFSDILDESVLELFLRHPYAMIATNGSGWQSADAAKRGLIHPRSFGTTARVLSYYVREKKTFALKEAVYKMSGLPASFMGLTNRGLIKEGFAADIVIFDKDKVQDLASFEHPYRYPQGISYVLTNGQIAIDKGNYTGLLAGQILI